MSRNRLKLSRALRARSHRRGVAVLLLAACCALLSTPALTFDLTRPLDRGGQIGEYVNRIVAAAGRQHIISGDCMSACTMWLGHDGVCVTADAVLWFHAASDNMQAMRTESPWNAISAAGNRALLAMYPPRVRAIVRPWLQSPDFHTLSGIELAALGVPLCRQG